MSAPSQTTRLAGENSPVADERPDLMMVLGLYFDDAQMLQAAGAVAGLSLDTDIASIVSGWQSDVLGTIGDLLDFAWVFITQIYIPALNVFDAALAGIQILPRITPPGLGASLAIAAVANGLAFAGLAASGCIPPMHITPVFVR